MAIRLAGATRSALAGADDAALADAALTAALLCDGDSRVRVDPATGSNKYLCPPQPTTGLTCWASCTASPIGEAGFAAARSAWQDISAAASPRLRALRLAGHAERLSARLLDNLAATGLAQAILFPSGTDALLAAALLLAAERPGRPMTAILPCPAETGTGVPLAAKACRFDGAASGEPLCDSSVDTLHVALRDQAGAPIAADALDSAYAAAVAQAPARPVVYLTHGTKTGLITPATPPAGDDVIVDACQARIAPAEVAGYLRRGWPVAITGSKFLGGPAFSGALLVPLARLGGRTPEWTPPGLGTVLRWTAALAGCAGFAARANAMAPVLAARLAAVQAALAACDALVPVAGLQRRGDVWADLPSIVTFAVRDPSDRERLLSAAELRPLYTTLADAGLLLGQPVGLGRFGGLRIAIGARNLLAAEDSSALSRLVRAINRLTAPAAPRRRVGA